MTVDRLRNVQRWRGLARAPGERIQRAPCRVQRAIGATARNRDCARRSCRRQSAVGRSGWSTHLTHRVLRPWIVEACQQHQRPVADVPVGVLGNRLEQRRHGLSRRRAPNHARCVGASGVVEVAELVDGGLKLSSARRPEAATVRPAPNARTTCSAKNRQNDGRPNPSADRANSQDAC